MLKPQQVAIALTLGGDAIALAPQPITLTTQVMIMTIVSDLVLIESKSARDSQLERVSSERAQDILHKVKSLYFALWKGEGIATTEQLADFYEVGEANIRQLLKTHRLEFESDGLKTLRSKALDQVRDLLSLTPMAVNATVWTPRAALRLGMLLRDSTVAKAVRTSLLDVVEQVIPNQAQEIERLKLELELVRAKENTARAEESAARSQERLVQTTQAIAALHGTGTLALILGKPDAVVERVTEVEKTVLVNQSGKPLKTYRGLSKTKLARRYGFKKPQDLVNWLESIGKLDLLQPGLTAAPCHYLPIEYVPELDRLWALRQGSRQRLLGE